jgi:hypothetical protein
MIGDGRGGEMAGLDHDEVAAALAGYFPTESFKDFYNFLGPQ